MPDESDEGDDGEPADGPEEPPESPNADPERGSPIDPSDLDTHDASDDPDQEVDADDAAADVDEDALDTPTESEETDAGAGDRNDDGSPFGGADDDEGKRDDENSDEAVVDDAGDGSNTDASEDGTEVDDETGVEDDVDDTNGEDDRADGGDSTGDADDDRGVSDLDDFPSVKPDPVDIDSSEGTDSDTESEDADVVDASGDVDDGTAADTGVDEETGDLESEADTDAENATSDADEVVGSEDDEDDEDDEEDASDGTDLPEAQTDGEGYVRDQPGGSYGDEDLGGISTPPDDEEMPLADHIEEMILRLAVVFLVGAAGTAIGLLGASPAIDYIWANVLPVTLDAPPHVYHPLELWLTRIKVAALLGILVGLPMFVYQCYLFMRPGLYPNERKYYLSAVPMSLVLAVVGMYVSFVLVLPILFRYFTFYSEGSAGIAYALGETFNLIITLTGFLAIVFQIPLFVMLAIMMGVTTRRWLADKRLYFWAAFFGLSFMFTMDPTLMAPIIVAIIMVVLFEGTLLLLRWTGQE